MKNGRLLALVLFLATLLFIAIGTIWPSQSALDFTGGKRLVRSADTPQAALQNLGQDLKSSSWAKAYDSLANKAEFSQADFEHDLLGYYPNLRTYARVGDFEFRPMHASATEADFRVMLHWATVVGDSVNARQVHLIKNGDRWQVAWPVEKRQTLPPQVIPVNYLRWDVIYRGAGDDWGSGDVEAPHVKIVDMHPVQRAEGTVILGEMLNEDVVPAYVSVTATLYNKNQKALSTEGSFDKIQHLLLPKQVTPFLIRFPDVKLANVGSVKMTPFSTLIPASADPVIAIQNEKIAPVPNSNLTGELVNQSGQITNIAHVIATFYDQSGNVVWIADQYVDHALLPGTPVPFTIHIPVDLAHQVSSQRTVIASYSTGGKS